ncbi:hypothetical protein ABZ698_07585 [Streptomyces antibioticus]
MTEEQLTGLEARIQKAGRGREQDVVRTWLKEHRGLVEKWVPVAESGEKSGAGR